MILLVRFRVCGYDFPAMDWRLIFGLCGLLLAGTACGPTERPIKQSSKKTLPKKPARIEVVVLSAKENDRRKQFSKQVCSSCHVWPEPGVLHRKAWVEVLDKMQPWLGLEPIPDDVPDELRGLFPSEKMIKTLLERSNWLLPKTCLCLLSHWYYSCSIVMYCKPDGFNGCRGSRWSSSPVYRLYVLFSLRLESLDGQTLK